MRNAGPKFQPSGANAHSFVLKYAIADAQKEALELWAGDERLMIVVGAAPFCQLTVRPIRPDINSSHWPRCARCARARGIIEDTKVTSSEVGKGQNQSCY